MGCIQTLPREEAPEDLRTRQVSELPSPANNSAKKTPQTAAEEAFESVTFMKESVDELEQLLEDYDREKEAPTLLLSALEEVCEQLHSVNRLADSPVYFIVLRSLERLRSISEDPVCLDVSFFY